MNSLSQDSVTSSEQSRIKRENTLLIDKTALVDSFGIDNVRTPNKNESIGTSSGSNSKLIKAFPWITDFSKMCQAEIGLTRINLLENLMSEYIRHVSDAAHECHLKPNRSAKLKKSMNGTLLLFHLFYSDIKKPIEHSLYLDKTSDLMAMYIDLEITASSRSKECSSKIASKLTTSLFIFLDRSHDHILDAIFKAKCINKNFWELCNLIFSRVLRDSPGRAVCDWTYVRYVLAFKLWKRIVKGIDEKRNIMKLASMKLHPPPLFKESVKAGVFADILPKVPRSRNDITMFLMQAKFCIKEKIKAFLNHINKTEQRGSLCSYLSSFSRIPFASSNDTDDSKVFSEEDQEESQGGSTALINNIWSSMSGNSEVAHQIRMAAIINGKKQKNKFKKTKCKGIATPVFKSNNSQTCNSADKLKKRRRLQQMSELPTVKPLPTSLLMGKCSNQTNVSVVRPRIEPPPESMSQTKNIKTCQSPSIVSIKQEPKDPENIVADSAKNTEQVSKVDSVFPGEKNDKVPNSDSPNLKLDKACSPQIWRDRGRTPESVTSTIERILPQQSLPGKEDNNQLHRAAQEVASVKSLITFSQCPQIPQDPKQEFIKKTVERIQESGRSFHKSQIKPTKACTDQQQEPNSKSELETVQDKCKGMLHDETLRKDFMIFTSQHVFRSNLLSNTVPPETSVPSPYSNGWSEETSKRCNCLQCTANQTALVTNYKTLTQYLESKQMVAGGSSSDKIQDSEPASCLPFKKRKTVSSVGKEEDEQDGKAISSGARDDEVSYPNTPMISIAMIDPKVQSLASTTNSLFPPAIDYSVSSSSLNCGTQSSLFIVSTVEQLAPSDTVLKVEEQSSIQPKSEAFCLSKLRNKFKIPAPLKENSSKIQNENPSISHSTDCPQDANIKPKTQSGRPTSAKKKKPRPDLKVDRQLRKRK